MVLPPLDAAYNVARWLVGDPTLAEDVVQDATVRALRYFASYRGRNARAWLLQIVRNAAHEARAARLRHAAANLDDASYQENRAALDVPDTSDDPEAALRRCEDHVVLNDALAGLPVDLRECLVLREFRGSFLQGDRASDRRPIGTVMSRLRRAH